MASPEPSRIDTASVVVATDRFEDDLAQLTGTHGFRIESIFPADAPDSAVVSGHGLRLSLRSSATPQPVTIEAIVRDGEGGTVLLGGGSTITLRPTSSGLSVPPGEPALVVAHDNGSSGAGRAGMRYRDLVPGRWGGRFIASHITIRDGGPVPDYVHFHRVRFQTIVVAAGWVRVVYEDQGEPFVMHPGDCVLQPPEIRHQVLEASAGAEVFEVACPALHHTVADWSLDLPNGFGSAVRAWRGQRFARHIAAGATYMPWRHAGWECRDTGITEATTGLAGVRMARPLPDENQVATELSTDGEFALLVALAGEVTFTADGDMHRLRRASSVAVPPGLRYALHDATRDCELLDVTLPG